MNNDADVELEVHNQDVLPDDDDDDEDENDEQKGRIQGARAFTADEHLTCFIPHLVQLNTSKRPQKGNEVWDKIAVSTNRSRLICHKHFSKMYAYIKNGQSKSVQSYPKSPMTTSVPACTPNNAPTATGAPAEGFPRALLINGVKYSAKAANSL